MDRVGVKIKYYRKKRNLTLKEMAKRTGLSTGYLSNVERDLTSPTYDNLCAICNAMQVNIRDFITQKLLYEPCIKKASRDSIYPKDYRFQYEYITDTQLPMVGVCMTLPADYYGKETSWGHDTDEYGIIVKGSIIFEVEGKTYLLEEGDTIYVKAGSRHQWRKSGEGECVSYWTRINYVMNPAISYHNCFIDDLEQPE